MIDLDTETRWSSLMRAANRGDEAAYRRLLAELAPAIRKVVRKKAARYGLSAADVEDAVQESLMAIHLKRATWREDEAIRPWVFTIAGYKAIDQLRRRSRGVEVDIADFAETLPAEAGSEPAAAFDLERLLARLSGRAAEILRAIGLEGASIAEAAARFGMSEAAVKMAYRRGFHRLRDLHAEPAR